MTGKNLSIKVCIRLGDLRVASVAINVPSLTDGSYREWQREAEDEAVRVIKKVFELHAGGRPASSTILG